MDYRQFVKRLTAAPEAVPRRLTHEDVVAKAISREDLTEDVRGINASLELIRKTRGGGWPTEAVTEEYNYVDLVWHEAEFRDGGSYTYALYTTALDTTQERYLGCLYLYPMGRRTELTEELLGHDVDVSWWVTPTAYEQGYYPKVYRALRSWLTELPFERPYLSNREIPVD